MNRNVFITGASSGIGEALAKVLVGLGFGVGLVARRRDRLEALALSLRSMNPKARVAIAVGDVTQATDFATAYQALRAELGPFDTVIANAGYAAAGEFERLNTEIYRKQFETNVFGLIETVKVALPDVVQNRGRIVLIGSVNSHVSEPYKSPYCMSKFAVKALADSLYFEMKPKGVSVTLISPGIVDSEIRKVSNRGEFRADAVDRSPHWLRKDPLQAAREICRAMECRKRQQTITFHARLIIFLHWLCPPLLRPFFKSQEGRYRAKS